ncbi:TetR/AcrR family transcriptional regulator [Anaerocolumna sp.]|uniref:TetR/AcrR family transcriptional regulator n=1 Tax=Anaerocolumna sp. TaxID=2041569 RepID=UPI0028A7020E|nr:TetR/AcrR family transcriptional regulator [Anaerocolumna sp.]
MARKAVLEGGKKDEILNVALELFLKNGYENTSIRMILERVGGEVGMFYHYFDSKQEVFDKAFQHFMKKQGEKFSSLMVEQSTDITYRKKIEQIIDCYDAGMSDYKVLFRNNVHWTVASALHDMTLEAMFPAFKKILFALMQSDEVSAPYKMEWHARFLFQGIGGVLHENSFEKITKEQRVDFILKLIGKTLEIPQCRFEAPFYIK